MPQKYNFDKLNIFNKQHTQKKSVTIQNININLIKLASIFFFSFNKNTILF